MKNTSDIADELQSALNLLSQIDSSETFTAMLADPLFAIDDDDMGYLIHQLESMICSVKSYSKIDKGFKKTEVLDD